MTKAIMMKLTPTIKGLLSFFFPILLFSLNAANLHAGGASSRPLREEATEEYLPPHTLTKVRVSPKTTLSYSVRDGSDYPIIGNDAPTGMHLSSSPQAMPLSYDNGWPSKVRNVSIFPYLARHGHARQYPDFCQFVETYYKSSCALVYYPPLENFSVMLGSGGLIGDYETVATARHVIEGLEVDGLYARFYDYHIRTSPDNPSKLYVQEQHMDVKIEAVEHAKGGLDACYLRLTDASNALKSQYMNPLPPAYSTSPFPWRDGVPKPFGTAQTLPGGHYALFHFAGGQHLISVGNIDIPLYGSWLHSNIEIEAGPGASGAVPIQKNMSRVEGYGVSIHRHILDQGRRIFPQRRIIPFWYFVSGIQDYDGITTPYAPEAQPLDDGYEFLSWTLSKYALQNREEKPGGPHYNCQVGHACHHIIPIRDLMYLWDYFDDTNNTYGRGNWWHFRYQLGELCPFTLNEYHKLPRNSRDWHHTGTQTRKFFAWTWWNLFRGPKDRRDDPRWEGSQNEKVRPSSFPQSLWNPVQSLFWRIQHLKELDQLPQTKKHMKRSITEAEDAILEALGKVQKEWHKTFLHTIPYVLVRQYRPDEWGQNARTKKWALR